MKGCRDISLPALIMWGMFRHAPSTTAVQGFGRLAPAYSARYVIHPGPRADFFGTHEDDVVQEVVRLGLLSWGGYIRNFWNSRKIRQSRQCQVDQLQLGLSLLLLLLLP